MKQLINKTLQFKILLEFYFSCMYAFAAFFTFIPPPYMPIFKAIYTYLT